VRESALPVILDGLAEIADRYDGFIIDLWGVIHDGGALYPGAHDALTQLAARGRKTVMLSNAPRRAEFLVEQMAVLGVERSLFGAVMSSGEAVHRELRARRDPWFGCLGRHYLLIGAPGDAVLLDGLDFERRETVEEADFLLNTGLAGIDDTVERHLPLFERAIRAGLPMICANPDLVVVQQGRPFLCAGTLAARYRFMGGDVVYRGKPDPAIYDDCLALLGISDRCRVLAVGDAFETDVKGARGAGLDSLLIMGGIHADTLQDADGARIVAAAQSYGGFVPTMAAPAFCW